MGVDFIRKIAKPYKKSLDKARAELATSDLLTRTPDAAVCIAAFEIAPRARLAPGDSLTVEPDGAQLVARHGVNEVARASTPPQHLLNAVRGSAGIAKGKVEQVHAVAGVAEISVC